MNNFSPSYFTAQNSKVAITGLSVVGVLLMIASLAGPTLKYHPEWSVLIAILLIGTIAIMFALFKHDDRSADAFKADFHSSYSSAGNTDSRHDNTPNSPDDDAAESSVMATAMADLKKLGTDPMQDDSGILFRYQGGYFSLIQTNKRTVRVIYPRIYSVPVEAQNLLARMLNRINSTFLIVKLMAMPEPDEQCVTVHAVADLLYSSEISRRAETLREILQIFFDTQHSLAVAMAAAQISVINDAEPSAIEREISDIDLN